MKGNKGNAQEKYRRYELSVHHKDTTPNKYQRHDIYAPQYGYRDIDIRESDAWELTQNLDSRHFPGMHGGHLHAPQFGRPDTLYYEPEENPQFLSQVFKEGIYKIGDAPSVDDKNSKDLYTIGMILNP